MNQFEQIENNKLQFIVDISIYNDSVLSKVLYWLSDTFLIERYSINEQNQKIILEKKKGIINSKEYVDLKEKVSQDLLDFKMRDIVNTETRNIRDILYIKAFANNDDFEDYNLIEE